MVHRYTNLTWIPRVQRARQVDGFLGDANGYPEQIRAEMKSLFDKGFFEEDSDVTFWKSLGGRIGLEKSFLKKTARCQFWRTGFGRFWSCPAT